MATPNPRWRCILRLTAIVLMLCAAQDVAGQDAPRGKVPAPKNVSMETTDGVALKATYYASNRGKEAVAVVLLHDFKGSRHELDGLARWLQEEFGHAVVVPDLRGHGDSTEMRLPAKGKTVELNPTKLNRQDFMSMMFDLDAVRRHLVEENDRGKLNLNELCLVGSGMGATIALNWAARDWSYPPLAVGKQGQDVKGVVLVSPSWSFKGVPVGKALTQPGVQKEISILIVHNRQSERDAQRIHKRVSRYHPDFEPKDPEFEDEQDLFMQAVNSPLTGTKLLVDARTGVAAMVRDFLEMRLVKKDFEWVKRSLD